MVHRPEGAAEHEEVLAVWSDGIVWRVPGLLCRDINEAEEPKKKRYHMTKPVIRLPPSDVGFENNGSETQARVS